MSLPSTRIPRYPSTRVTSPGVAAAAFASASAAPIDQKRSSALMFVNSVSEVIGLIESEYRELLRPTLNKLADDARRLQGASAGLLKLEQHHNGGTFPPFLEGNRLPALQVAAEFALGAGKTVLSEFSEEHKNFKKSALRQAILVKTAEVASLSSRLAPEVFVPGLMTTVHGRYNELKVRVKEPVWGVQEDNIPENDEDNDVVMAEPGQLIITDWTYSPVLRNAYEALLKDLPAIGLRVIMCAQAAGDKSAALLTAKKSLKARADVEMGDSTGSSGSGGGQASSSKGIQSLVDRAVASALKKHTTQAGGKKPSTKDGKSKGKGKKSAPKHDAARNAAKKNVKTKRGKRGGKGGKAGKKTQ